MSRDVMQQAQSVGFWQEHTDIWMCTTEDVKRFAELVRADEREAVNRVAAKREWVGLTADEVAICWDLNPERAMRNVAVKLKEKNA